MRTFDATRFGSLREYVMAVLYSRGIATKQAERLFEAVDVKNAFEALILANYTRETLAEPVGAVMQLRRSTPSANVCIAWFWVRDMEVTVSDEDILGVLDGVIKLLVDERYTGLLDSLS